MSHASKSSSVESHRYTFQQAMSLARNIVMGLDDQPVPNERELTVDEAIARVENCPTMHDCNWITGQAALAALRKSKIEGDQAYVLVVPGLGVCE
jgi:hypothetical protein